MIALGSLPACLPDNTRSQAIQQHELVENKLNQQSMAALQYALASQNALSRNEDWQNQVLPQGTLKSLGISIGTDEGVSARDLSSGYCRDDTDPLDIKEMVVTWFSSQTGGRFTLRGVGESAGPFITAQISRISGNNYTGQNREGIIELAGNKDDTGLTQIILPTGCNLGIPEAAPVVIAYMQREETGQHVSTQIGYLPGVCGPGQFGTNVQKQYSEYDPFLDDDTDGDVTPYFNACVSVMPVCKWVQHGKTSDDCSTFDLGCNGNPPCDSANAGKSWSWGTGKKPRMICECT